MFSTVRFKVKFGNKCQVIASQFLQNQRRTRLNALSSAIKKNSKLQIIKHTLQGRPLVLQRTSMGSVSRTLEGTRPSEYLNQITRMFLISSQFHQPNVKIVSFKFWLYLKCFTRDNQPFREISSDTRLLEVHQQSPLYLLIPVVYHDHDHI